jgi:hypothetical protein
MRLTPPRPNPEKEDHYLACAVVDPVIDGFWTRSQCYCGSWLSVNRWLRWFSPGMEVRVYQGKSEVHRVLTELRRQTALHDRLKAAQPDN